MLTPCKNCKALSHSDFPAEHHTARFDEFGQQIPGNNDKWICRFDCDAEICINCYMHHIDKFHPKLYSCKCITCKQMTHARDFREYNWCVKCIDQKPDAATDT